MLMNYLFIGFIVSWICIILRYAIGISTEVMNEIIDDIICGHERLTYIKTIPIVFMIDMILWPILIISTVMEIMLFIKTGKRVF